MTAPVVVPFEKDERISRDDALRELHDLGAHFVLCRNKKAITEGWQLSRPAIDTVLRRGTKDDVAVMPASLGLVVVDLDVRKEPGDKPNERVHRSIERQNAVRSLLGAPLATVDSPGGGAHLHHKGTGVEGNSVWAYGEVRGARGYVVLYDPAATLKAAQLVRDDPSIVPADVKRLPKRNSKKKTRNAEPRPTPEGLAQLTAGRNNSLNDGVFRDARDGRLTPEREEEWRTAALASGLPSTEIDSTIRSAKDSGEKAEIEFIRHPTTNQIVAKSQKNIWRALQQVDAHMWYDDFSNKPMIQYGAFQGAYEDPQRDRILSDIEETCKFIPPEAYFDRIVGDLARRTVVHPVRQYLESLAWDQTPRIDEWLEAYAGVQQSGDSERAYVRAVSRIFLMAAVGRVYRPGVKFDEMVVLESKQGTGKSSLLRALCRNEDWFSDDLPLNVDAKQIIERTAGKWLIEASDLSGMGASAIGSPNKHDVDTARNQWKKC